jgi:tetratricopeptide (TPR) repeat protein
MAITIASLSVLGVVIKLIAGVDFTSDPGWVTLELLRHAVYAALLLIGLALVVVRSTKDTSLDDRPMPWGLYGMLAGLAVFLIHNTIDFSLFETGPMLLFMLIGGAVLGARSQSLAGVRKRNAVAIAAFVTLLIGWFLAAIFVAVPLAQAEGRAHDGDDAYRKHDFAQAAQDYQAAFIAAPAKDPDYAVRAARALMATQNDGAARTNLTLSIAANPHDPLGYLTRARYSLSRHPDEQTEIRHDFERALELNPNDLESRLEYAGVLEKFGDRDAAREQYRLALKTNDGFDPTEPKRLSQARVDEINQKIAGK